MWREAKIAFPDALSALNCSIVPAHPWVYGLGQQTETGAYLSPTNAVQYLAAKLLATGGRADVTIFMICGDTHDSFMKSLNTLAAVFPAPAFTQVSRMAQAAAELQQVKMQLPGKGGNSLPAAVPLSVSTNRAALNALRTAQAQAESSAGASLAGIYAELASFATEHASQLAQIKEGMDTLKGLSAKAWVFTGSGELVTVATELAKSVPQPSAVYTVAMMFVADDLGSLGGMIHDIDRNAGA